MSNLPKEFLSVQGLGTQGLHKQLRSLLRNKVSNRKLISYIFFSLLHYVQSCLYSLADVFLKRDLPTSYFAVLSTKVIEIVYREGVTRLLFNTGKHFLDPKLKNGHHNPLLIRNCS